MSAIVVQIDHMTGFVDKQASRYTWRGPDDRSARVVLAIPDRTRRSGLPVIVLFGRCGTDTVTRDPADRLPVPGDDA